MGLRAGCDGRRVVEDVAVDNPLAALGLDVEGKVRTARTVAQVNLSESPVEHMFYRGEIDDRLRKAADVFRSWCEQAASIGNSINYDSVVVDCSRRGLGFPERAVAAVRNLAKAKDKLGVMDFDLLRQAVAIGNSIAEIAASWYPGAEGISQVVEARRHVGRRIKDALALFAELVGLGDLRPLRARKRRLYVAFASANVHSR